MNIYLWKIIHYYQLLFQLLSNLKVFKLKQPNDLFNINLRKRKE